MAERPPNQSNVALAFIYNVFTTFLRSNANLNNRVRFPVGSPFFHFLPLSYRVAETGDVPRVALESGNSPAMIFTHYRELVTPEDAMQWFAIAPAKAKAAPRVMVTPPAPVAARNRVLQMN